RSGQNGKEPEAELAKVCDIDPPVAIEIEVTQVTGLRRVQSVGPGKQTQVGDVDMTVAIGVAEEAEKGGRVVGRHRSAAGIEHEIAIDRQLIVAVDQRAELRHQPAKGQAGD